MEKSFQQHLLRPSISFSCQLRSTIPIKNINRQKWMRRNGPPLILCCSSSTSSSSSSSAEKQESSTAVIRTTTTTNAAPPVKKKRNRYRKQCPGESKGITEELRFVAMRLRNVKGKRYNKNDNSSNENKQGKERNNGLSLDDDGDGDGDGDGNGKGEIWQPSMEGFVKYLVDCKLVFETVERIVDVSNDVSYAYFRKTGLERSESLSKDLEWFSQQDIVIPEPTTHGVSYAKYLEELAEKSPPLFLCHFYNIYFSHIAGGQVIARRVSERLIEGRELEFYKWEGDVQELLKVVREKFNMLGEHWSRDQKNKCLKEATKSFRFLGQIVRLIIL